MIIEFFAVIFFSIEQAQSHARYLVANVLPKVPCYVTYTRHLFWFHLEVEIHC